MKETAWNKVLRYAGVACDFLDKSLVKVRKAYLFVGMVLAVLAFIIVL